MLESVNTREALEEAELLARQIWDHYNPYPRVFLEEEVDEDSIDNQAVKVVNIVEAVSLDYEGTETDQHPSLSSLSKKTKSQHQLAEVLPLPVLAYYEIA